MGEAIMLDVYTVGQARTRKTVFAPGEFIEFRALHTLTSDLPLGTPARVTWVLEFQDGLFDSVDEASRFDVLFDFRKAFSLTHTFPGRTVIAWQNLTVPQPTPIQLTGTRDQVIQSLRNDRRLLFFPGVWKLTGRVELTEAATGRPFSTLCAWYYRVLA